MIVGIFFIVPIKQLPDASLSKQKKYAEYDIHASKQTPNVLEHVFLT